MRREVSSSSSQRGAHTDMVSKPITKTISITSGKGGVGKTITVVNTAQLLADRGSKVLVVDADLGLANVDLMLGLNPRFTLEHVLKGERSIDDIIVRSSDRLHVIPAASGVERMTQLTDGERLQLKRSVERIALEYDYLLVDTQAGIGPDVLFFNAASSLVVIVVTPEITSITDAYALIKTMSRHQHEKSFGVIVNNVPPDTRGGVARKVFTHLADVSSRYLGVGLSYLGYVSHDSLMHASLRSQMPLVVKYPGSRAVEEYSRIINRVDQVYPENQLKGGVQFFFESLLNAM